ncbi:hypothetical protein GVanDAA622_26490 [Enterococcus faecium]|uniref:TetR family transcriptional regulator n=1 Tax=Enterococcus faecium TaxID=1352 RepID=UPI001C75991B|nr:TetR family transcriptional regulator [Enterococcus faecium]BCZ37958.1 hypothetical protein GVanDAA622_26490 [Enterococcus faecium]
MPRFTEQEKEIISSKLLIEGEKLFALHGLKKVTVDDLVAAVNISKGLSMLFIPVKNIYMWKSIFAYKKNYLQV